LIKRFRKNSVDFMMVELISAGNKVLCLQEGAMLHSLQKDNTEYLWQGDEAHWAGQAPVCFPIVGVLENGRASAFGKECRMGRHGVARINSFEIKEQGKNYVTFIQTADENTKQAFPFDYILEIKYILTGSMVTTEYTVINNGKEKLPFVIGGHPAFNCPLCEDESFEDYRVIFDKAMTKRVLRPNHATGLVDVSVRYDALNDSDTIHLKHNLFEEKDAMIFDAVEAKSALLTGKNGKGIRIEYQDFSNLLIWSACNQANFVALEPWTGISNCSDENEIFEKKRGMTVLEPGETASFKFKITMI